MRKKNGNEIVNLNVAITEEMIEESLVALSNKARTTGAAAFNFLVPEGYRPVIELCDENGRGKHRNSRVDTWRPDVDEIRIYFEPVGSKTFDMNNICKYIKDMCEALKEAESGQHEFISLTWFRDAYLIRKAYQWVSSPRARQMVLLEAINKNQIVVYKIPNPKNPEYPTTAIRSFVYSGPTENEEEIGG